MSGRADSETHPEISAVDEVSAAAVPDGGEDARGAEGADDTEGHGDDPQDGAEVARRARWTAAGTGALLTLAGIAACLLRLRDSAPALVPAAYAVGAAVCAGAALLGQRGHTRRALWLLIVGVMVMALGDQSD
ncbi:hypothetical protein GCM10014715_77340 [Streptomyces spiralis]|uniref:Uncharacterized protein n=1 Tax=Streptomyces spiralis TaxID=66376 RepID=A0A919AIE4_9ACTN|nr:hypothetical protein [Streptomyces spiralis]GHF10096.1 hypothetical protein GCM10014715_77340 [Streptomyces spiralis]